MGIKGYQWYQGESVSIKSIKGIMGIKVIKCIKGNTAEKVNVPDTEQNRENPILEGHLTNSLFLKI